MIICVAYTLEIDLGHVDVKNLIHVLIRCGFIDFGLDLERYGYDHYKDGQHSVIHDHFSRNPKNIFMKWLSFKTNSIPLCVSYARVYLD